MLNWRRRVSVFYQCMLETTDRRDGQKNQVQNTEVSYSPFCTEVRLTRETQHTYSSRGWQLSRKFSEKQINAEDRRCTQ